MPSFNKVVLMGNLTRDPQIKHLPNNLVIAEFGVACNRRYRTASGEDKDEVVFVDCSAFGRQAETIGQYCTKGKPLFIEGRLKFDTWDDKQGGGKRSKLTVVVENFQFIGARDEHESLGDAAPEAPHARSEQPARSGKKWSGSLPERRGRKQAPEQPFGEEPQFAEADIPF